MARAALKRLEDKPAGNIRRVVLSDRLGDRVEPDLLGLQHLRDRATLLS